MTKYFVAIYRPQGFDPSVSVDQQMLREIDAFNEEMVAAGIRLFVGGLQPLTTAVSIISGLTGEPTPLSGPPIKTDEYLDGFWVLELSGQDEAIHWGKKAASACRAAVEVRPFH